jgi:hypothetical protein
MKEAAEQLLSCSVHIVILMYMPYVIPYVITISQVPNAVYTVFELLMMGGGTA